MKIFPAIDIIGGEAVRLYKGDYGKVKVYDSDVCAVAKRFYDSGARFLHVVDLDGAKSGGARNFSVVEKIASATGMFCEIGGGVRSMDTIHAYLESGAGRVILGTAAINNPDLLKKAVDKYGDKVCVGVDTKNGSVAVNGWLEVTSVNGIEFCKALKDIGVKSIIYTDIAKDGALQGTNMELYEELSTIDGIEITASGGISSLDEIIRLKEIGIPSAILGKAIYEGVLELKSVIDAVGEQR